MGFTFWTKCGDRLRPGDVMIDWSITPMRSYKTYHLIVAITDTRLATCRVHLLHVGGLESRIVWGHDAYEVL